MRTSCGGLALSPAGCCPLAFPVNGCCGRALPVAGCCFPAFAVAHVACGGIPAAVGACCGFAADVACGDFAAAGGRWPSALAVTGGFVVPLAEFGRRGLAGVGCCAAVGFACSCAVPNGVGAGRRRGSRPCGTVRRGPPSLVVAPFAASWGRWGATGLASVELPFGVLFTSPRPGVEALVGFCARRSLFKELPLTRVSSATCAKNHPWLATTTGPKSAVFGRFAQ